MAARRVQDPGADDRQIQMVRRILSHHRFLCPPRPHLGLVVGGPGTVPPHCNAGIYSKWYIWGPFYRKG